MAAKDTEKTALVVGKYDLQSTLFNPLKSS